MSTDPATPGIEGGADVQEEDLPPVPDPVGVVGELLDDRPRLRGRLHLASAIVSVAGLVLLVSVAGTTQARVAAWVYGMSGILLYGTSASYHVFAKSSSARRLLRRADHSMIFVLIAGSFTPICMLAMEGSWRWFLLGAVWTGAAIGASITVFALDRLSKVSFAMYLILGWAGLGAIPALIDRPGELAMLVTAGVLYTVGAILFGLHWPQLWPRWFGYHEVWHLLGVTAGILLFIVNLRLIRSAGT